MLFFIMLIMLGMDSVMGGLECVVTGLMDEWLKGGGGSIQNGCIIRTNKFRGHI